LGAGAGELWAAFGVFAPGVFCAIAPAAQIAITAEVTRIRIKRIQEPSSSRVHFAPAA